MYEFAQTTTQIYENLGQHDDGGPYRWNASGYVSKRSAIDSLAIRERDY
jgi:hypothetical protein